PFQNVNTERSDAQLVPVGGRRRKHDLALTEEADAADKLRLLNLLVQSESFGIDKLSRTVERHRHVDVEDKRKNHGDGSGIHGMHVSNAGLMHAVSSSDGLAEIRRR